MIRLKAPLEMGICVESPETMIGFYRDVLGFEMISDLRVPAEKAVRPVSVKMATGSSASRPIWANESNSSIPHPNRFQEKPKITYFHIREKSF